MLDTCNNIDIKDIILQQHLVEKANGGTINKEYIYIYEGGVLQIIDVRHGKVVTSHYFQKKIQHVEAITLYGIPKLLVAQGSNIQILDIHTGDVIEYIESGAFEGKTIVTFRSYHFDDRPDSLLIFVSVNSGEIFRIDLSIPVVGLTEEEVEKMLDEINETEEELKTELKLIKLLETVHTIEDGRAVEMIYVDHTNLLIIGTTTNKLISIHCGEETVLYTDMEEHFPSKGEESQWMMHSLIHPKDPERTYLMVASPNLPLTALYAIAYQPEQKNWLFKLMKRDHLHERRVVAMESIVDTIELAEYDTKFIDDCSKAAILYQSQHGLILEIFHLQQYLVDPTLYRAIYPLRGLRIVENVLGIYIDQESVYSEENTPGSITMNFYLFDQHSVYQYGIHSVNDSLLEQMMENFDAINSLQPYRQQQIGMNENQIRTQMIQYLNENSTPIPEDTPEEDKPFLYFMKMLDMLMDQQAISFLAMYIQTKHVDSLGIEKYDLYDPSIILTWLNQRLDLLKSKMDIVIGALLNQEAPRMISEEEQRGYVKTMTDAIHELNAYDVVTNALSTRIAPLDEETSAFDALINRIDRLKTSYGVIQWFTSNNLLPLSANYYPFDLLQSKWSSNFSNYLTDTWFVSMDEDCQIKTQSARLPFFIELLLKQANSTHSYPPRSIRDLVASFLYVDQTVEQKRMTLLIFLYLLIDMIEVDGSIHDNHLISRFVRHFHISLPYQELIYGFWTFDTWISERSPVDTSTSIDGLKLPFFPPKGSAMKSHDFSCLIRHANVVDDWSDDIIHRLFLMGSFYQAERFMLRHSCSNPMLRARVLLSSSHLFDAIDYSRTYSLCDQSVSRAIFMTTLFHAVAHHQLPHFYSIALTKPEESLLSSYFKSQSPDSLINMINLYILHGRFSDAMHLTDSPMTLANVFKALPLSEKERLSSTLDVNSLIHHPDLSLNQPDDDVMDDDVDDDIVAMDDDDIIDLD